MNYPLGWIPFSQRTGDMDVAHTVALAKMRQRFSITGIETVDAGPYVNLMESWKHEKVIQALGFEFPGIHQLTGSCLPANVPVRMADGTEKPISEIQVGDRVVTHTGKACAVVGVGKKRTDEQMRSIRLRGWADRLKCTDKHPLPIWSGEEIEWRYSKDVLPGDMLLVGYGTTEGGADSIDVLDWVHGCDLSEISHHTYHKERDVSPTHRRTSAVAANARRRQGLLGENRVTVSHGRLKNSIPTCADYRRFRSLGRIVSRRRISAFDHRVTSTLSASETTLAEEIVQLTRGVWGIESRIQRSKSMPGSIQVRVPSITLVRFVKSFVVGTAHTKRVPGIFFSSPVAVRRALLSGWFDGDGYAKPHDRGMRITGVSASRGLIRDFGQIALSCGVPSSTANRKARGISKEAGELSMWPAMARELPSTKLGAMPVAGKELKTCSRMTPFGMACRVVSNEAIGIPEDDVYDIDVQTDHTFLAWGMVVHNCVGAGGGNAIFTLAAIEVILKADPEQIILPFWLHPYGVSRALIGERTEGEGSLGSAFAEAAKRGCYSQTESGLPPFQNSDGLTWGKEIELDWSNGIAIPKKWVDLALKHPVKSTDPVKTAKDARDAIRNGYPLTFASPWYMDPGSESVQGRTDPICVGKLIGNGGHQTSILAVYDHPELGLSFLNVNQWGLKVYKTDPKTGLGNATWMTEKDMDKVCRSGDGEVYAFSQYDGYPAQTLPWSSILPFTP